MVKAQGEGSKTYTQVFGDKLVSLAKSDARILAISAAMPEGTGLDKFREAFPGRFFDVGIAEGHAVAFAAGLAKASGEPNRNKVGTITLKQAEEIATQKMPDLNTKDLKAAVQMVKGTARSMGIEVGG